MMDMKKTQTKVVSIIVVGIAITAFIEPVLAQQLCGAITSAESSSAGGSTSFDASAIQVGLSLFMAFSVLLGLLVSAIQSMRNMMDNNPKIEYDPLKYGFMVPIIIYLGLGLTATLFDVNIGCLMPV